MYIFKAIKMQPYYMYSIHGFSPRLLYSSLTAVIPAAMSTSSLLYTLPELTEILVQWMDYKRPSLLPIKPNKF